nr:hypothetical protein [uncultured Flavobacterium sp.]
MKVLRKNQIQIALQLIVSLLLIRYGLFKTLSLDHELSDFEFLNFIISLILIYVGSLILYLIIKQEKYPEKKYIKNIEKAYYKYLGVNSLGIGISFFLANEIGNVGYFGFFIAFAALLYLYMTQWIKIPLLSNIIFSVIATYPIFTLIVLEILPNISSMNAGFSNELLIIILFSFGILLTLSFLIKTLILDLIHVEEDRKHNKKTLATLHGIIVGSKRTAVLILLPILTILYFFIKYYNQLPLFSLYCLLGIGLPFLVAMIQLYRAKNTKGFKISNHILNIIIWLTIISIVFLFFNIKNYVAS